jgi:hypothetical protein
MCPVCITNTAAVVAGAGSTGGIPAVCIGRFRRFFRSARAARVRCARLKTERIVSGQHDISSGGSRPQLKQADGVDSESNTFRNAGRQDLFFPNGFPRPALSSARCNTTGKTGDHNGPMVRMTAQCLRVLLCILLWLPSPSAGGSGSDGATDGGSSLYFGAVTKVRAGSIGNEVDSS